MADTTFVSKSTLTPVTTAWLQDLNDLFYRGTKALTVTTLTASTSVTTPLVSASTSVTTPIVDSGSTGAILLKTNNGTTQGQFTHTASAVNFPTFTGSVVGQGVLIGVAGSDTDINLVLSSKGAGELTLRTNDNNDVQLSIIHTVGTTRRITITGSNGGNPTISTTAGSLAITPAVVMAGALSVAGTVFIGDTTNANSTLGLTINQAGADNEILSLKSSDVAHGVTTFTETDTYGTLSKVAAGDGGIVLAGYSEVTIGIELAGYYTTDTTLKSVAGVGAIFMLAGLKSGTGITSPGADANIFSVASGGVGGTRFILDADGDSHQDVGTAWTNFDHLDDIATLDALSYNVSRQDDPIKRKFGAFLLEKRSELERHKLVTFNKDGHHFVNMSKLTMLHTGAIRQLSQRIAQLEQLRLT